MILTHSTAGERLAPLRQLGACSLADIISDQSMLVLTALNTNPAVYSPNCLLLPSRIDGFYRTDLAAFPSRPLLPSNMRYSNGYDDVHSFLTAQAVWRKACRTRDRAVPGSKLACAICFFFPFGKDIVRHC